MIVVYPCLSIRNNMLSTGCNLREILEPELPDVLGAVALSTSSDQYSLELVNKYTHLNISFTLVGQALCVFNYDGRPHQLRHH